MNFEITVIPEGDNQYSIEIIEEGVFVNDPGGFEIARKLESLDEDQRLSTSAVKGLPELEQKVQVIDDTIHDLDCGRF